MPQFESVALPKRLPLKVTPQNRDGTTAKDAQLVNCYGETQPRGEEVEYWIFKRPGILQSTQPSGGAANGYGAFNWKGDIYTVFGNKLYKNTSAVTGTVDTTGGVYRFDSCLGTTPKLVLGNGVEAYTYDTAGGLVLVNDAQFPATFCKGWAYLNGTTYVLTSTAHIQGSDTNDPTAWDALNDIMAQIEPDNGKALTKQLAYAVAVKEWSTEVFHDAGNATGSPLGAVEGAKMNYGTVSADSLQVIDDIIFFLGSARGSSTQVVMIDRLKLSIISTKPIERLLQTADYTTVYSWQVQIDGHRFYGVTSKVSNWTLVYDLDEREWHRWTDVDGNYFPFVASTYNASGATILQHETNGRTYTVSATYVNDNGSVITSDIYPPIFDAGVQSRGKQLECMVFVGDKTPGSTLLVRKSDDDYQTWSNFRSVDMSVARPYLDNCGTFDRRAFHFRHQSNTKLRLKAVELQMDLCTA